MIQAKKSRLLTIIFGFVCNRLFRKNFDQLFIRGSFPEGTVIVIANHSNWWDGLLLFKLQQVVGRPLYVMMHEKFLRKLFFFRWLGAFSVNREHPKSVMQSLQYAAFLLQQHRTVCIFPQGDEFPLEQRPLGFESGVIYLSEKSPTTPIVPIAFYFGWSGKRKPNVWIDIGEAIYFSELDGHHRTERCMSLEKRFTAHLDALREAVIQQSLDFRKI